MIYFTKLQEEINSNDGAIGGHLSLGVCLEKVWSKWSRFAKQKYDKESVG